MSRVISIEYCTSWNYLPKAVSLANSILEEHKTVISSLNLIPSSGGVFKIRYNKQLLFSKEECGRFPNVNEVEKLLKEKLNIFWILNKVLSQNIKKYFKTAPYFHTPISFF